ncbi:MAG: transcriptional regulator [Chloroflexi bacterium]|jgi:DNA-binding HxlR family transcriptional regulator|nr:transcriptional regulator [Chloroflexota bacterium]
MAAKTTINGVSEEPKLATVMCPRYEKAAGILGKRWTGLIIRALMDGPRRFNELLKIVELVSDRLLTERLRELEGEGLVERIVYPESPVRIEYRLTAKGLAMKSVVDAIQEWASDWIDPADDEANH